MRAREREGGKGKGKGIERSQVRKFFYLSIFGGDFQKKTISLFKCSTLTFPKKMVVELLKYLNRFCFPSPLHFFFLFFI
jgi:hypothetical protein